VSKFIGHLDMDAFFAAVEERDKPRFRGRPIVVGADPMDGQGRGVVSTANYPARVYGIHSAMPISTAWKLAERARQAGKPAAVFLGVNMEKYVAVSERIMKLLRDFSPRIEPISVDEAFFEAGDSRASARELALKIKREIKEKENLTGSIGLGPNKLIAKIASGREKPDGLVLVGEEEIESFLADLSVREIPGIGPKAAESLAKIRVNKIKELRAISRDKLRSIFGKNGDDFYEKARGRGSAEMEEEGEPKSIGGQETFIKDTLDPIFLAERMAIVCEDSFRRFKESGFRSFSRIGIVVRFADFSSKTRSVTLVSPAGDLKTFQFECLRLLMPFLDKRENPREKLIRLIGSRLEKMA
jgi:DNA polymerase IV (DinB-like DNA polymerase)